VDFPCYLLLPLRPRYLPQRAILEHPHPTFLPQRERPSFTPIQSYYRSALFVVMLKLSTKIYSFLGNNLTLK
jgi:hypothetical protein